MSSEVLAPEERFFGRCRTAKDSLAAVRKVWPDQAEPAAIAGVNVEILRAWRNER
jgi:hypothetical protein